MPTVEIVVDGGGVFGVADLGLAQYQDEFVKTADGWRFPSRRVVNAAETGRVYLDDGSYYDDVYEQTGPGEWRIASRIHVPAAPRR